jgi:hypothetical protein
MIFGRWLLVLALSSMTSCVCAGETVVLVVDAAGGGPVEGAVVIVNSLNRGKRAIDTKKTDKEGMAVLVIKESDESVLLICVSKSDRDSKSGYAIISSKNGEWPSTVKIEIASPIRHSSSPFLD